MKYSTVHGKKSSLKLPDQGLPWNDDDPAILLTLAKTQDDLLQGPLAEKDGESFRHEHWCSDLEWVNFYRKFVCPLVMYLKSEKRAAVH